LINVTMSGCCIDTAERLTATVIWRPSACGQLIAARQACSSTQLSIFFGHIHRRVEDETLDRFLDWGDLHKGFARVHCGECGHE
jgi:hypothetical protein